MKRLLSLFSAVCFASPLFAADAPFPVSVTVDAAHSLGPLKPVWRFFGADEPNYTTMKDGRRLLGELGTLRPGEVYFRTHNLLTSGDGTPAHKWGSTNAYTEDAAGRPVYDWTIVDRIFSTGLARGVRPYVEIGFMPQALSTHPEPYQHEWRAGLPYERIYTGWAYPPKDFEKWGELVYQWAKHCVEEFGAAEVERWYWETWNEANIPYWQGTPEEFIKLHDYAIAAVRRALPTARVGGPDFAGHGGPRMHEFLEHCLRGKNHATGETGTPLDFISFHAKGSPAFVDGHIRMGIAPHLRTLDEGFAIVASYPELKAKPIVIGESDPEGCAACMGGQFTYRSGTVYSSYTAASFARKYDLAAKHGVNLEGVLTWAFEFEDQPYFAGQRVLSSNGIALPVLNVFRMFSRLGTERVAAESSGAIPLDDILRQGVRRAPDVGAFASRDAHQVAVVLWHYHDDDVAGPDAAVEFAVRGLPDTLRTARVSHARIDATHSNAFAEWKRMGTPLAPNQQQYDALQRASQLAQLAESPASVAVESGVATLHFALPRQAVSLVVLEWE
ncbi:GH39 family glycosyl hydrolase [Opitutus terrae]|uniref:Glycoside hydrolase family 39 n=1 Tax=Opitutus terrae (strain DSM 11246 / JCM 15787 / PB90-1) TaxID=452637 RepID=B1ZRW8_OPITP|nr:beta-xylosidase [Opitutus terrae]ACB74647.1 glycoside hydrolase family 39 [Opitutus terrae PB90-1]